MSSTQENTPEHIGSSTKPVSDSFFERLLSKRELVRPLTEPASQVQGQNDQPVNVISKLREEQVSVPNTRAVVSPHGDVGDGDGARGKVVPFELDDAPGQLYAFMQSTDVADFSFIFRRKEFTFYFDPASDNLVMRNRSVHPVHATSITEPDTKEALHTQASDPIAVEPRGVCELRPGPWRISSTNGIPIADLLVLRRQYTVKKTLVEHPKAGSKRRESSQGQLQPSKRIQEEDSTGRQTIVLFGAPQDPKAHGNVLLDLTPGQKIQVTSLSNEDPSNAARENKDPGLMSESYTLEHQRDIMAGKGFASVFSAQHETLGHVAVKVIRNKREPQYFNIPKLASDWKNEQGLLRRIKHGSIIGFFGADARFYSIYMEYLPFPDLTRSPWRRRADHFFSGTDDDAQRVVQDISSALAYLHELRIVHNDIKPANILFDRTRGPVLIDFGLATHNETEACGGGTPWYIPFEFLEDRKRGYPSDVFALGVTGLYLLRKIPLPDVTQLSWLIREVHASESAAERMTRWLVNVREQGEALRDDKTVERAVKRMLSNHKERISAADAAKLPWEGTDSGKAEAHPS